VTVQFFKTPKSQAGRIRLPTKHDISLLFGRLLSDWRAWTRYQGNARGRAIVPIPKKRRRAAPARECYRRRWAYGRGRASQKTGSSRDSNKNQNKSRGVGLNKVGDGRIVLVVARDRARSARPLEAWGGISGGQRLDVRIDDRKSRLGAWRKLAGKLFRSAKHNQKHDVTGADCDAKFQNYVKTCMKCSPEKELGSPAGSTQN
jgi:hypothetical protein